MGGRVSRLDAGPAAGDALVVRDVTVRDGELHLPDVPGNGLDWDEDAVARYQTGP